MEMKYMMATKAMHQMGDISRDVPSLALIYDETEHNFIGEWVTGIGFINVRFLKETTRELTPEEKIFYNNKVVRTAGIDSRIVIEEEKW